MKDLDRLAELGDDWCDLSEGSDLTEECDRDHASLSRELRTEVHPAHPFFGAALEVIAHRWSNDDVLCRHLDTPARYSIIHLTWSKREEIGSCPTIDADGEWSHIVAYEDGIDAALSAAEALEQDGRRAPMGPAGTASRPITVEAVHAWPEVSAVPPVPQRSVRLLAQRESGRPAPWSGACPAGHSRARPRSSAFVLRPRGPSSRGSTGWRRRR